VIVYTTPEVLRETKPLTVGSLQKLKQTGEKIACLTAYDATFATAMDRAATDVVLVGDSLGNVVQGLDTTIPVTVDDICYHGRAVSRGLHRAFQINDMPFMSYATLDQAVVNATRLMQEGGAQMVKLEGNSLQADIVEYLAARGIPVCAHLGLRPQYVHKLGGFKVMGRDEEMAAEMKEDARILEEAGADMLLLECVTNSVAAEISANAKVPVIGIGAGPDTDGQILVMHDVLGVLPGWKPRFVQNFMEGNTSIIEAFSTYVDAVKSGEYPAPEYTFGG
jgi:3-methyl-2-oxobutanoate hydroxymethyltransferase